MLSLNRVVALVREPAHINRKQDFAFIGPEDKISLLDLSDGRRQLLVKRGLAPTLAIQTAIHRTFNPDHPRGSGQCKFDPASELA